MCLTASACDCLGSTEKRAHWCDVRASQFLQEIMFTNDRSVVELIGHWLSFRIFVQKNC